MQKLASERSAFWVGRRLFGPLAPYDRCFGCGSMHLPPDDLNPHNGRYDFVGDNTALEVVSMVNSELLRNFASWTKAHPGGADVEAGSVGLTLPWLIDIPAAVPTVQRQTIIDIVRDMEHAGIRTTDHLASSPFHAYVDDEHLITPPGMVTIMATGRFDLTLPDLTTLIQKLLRPEEGRSDVLRKMDLGASQGKERRTVCFVLDQVFSFSLHRIFDRSFRPESLLTPDWDAMRPVTDIIVLSQTMRKAFSFSTRSPARRFPVRDVDKPPAPRTLGCR
ncbi:hypothetical protein ABT263_32550 [Kitasatospora sp. NPDC001603]|uniref:hypothetical protein n=1 Tax=Kitasatospora sp. NPDC001603 TaxID=3154388 RepID=UPI003321AFEA